MCQSGIREDMDYAQLAIKRYGIISKTGAWFTVSDPNTGEVLERGGKPVKLNGLTRVYEFLQSDRDYYERLKKFILDDINGSSEEFSDGSSDEVL